MLASWPSFVPDLSSAYIETAKIDRWGVTKAFFVLVGAIGIKQRGAVCAQVSRDDFEPRFLYETWHNWQSGARLEKLSDSWLLFACLVGDDVGHLLVAKSEAAMGFDWQTYNGPRSQPGKEKLFNRRGFNAAEVICNFHAARVERTKPGKEETYDGEMQRMRRHEDRRMPAMRRQG